MAISSAVVWEIRPGLGSVNNGGGFKTGASGTDFSQQNSPLETFTNLHIDAVDSTIISDDVSSFDASYVGNILNITGGTGFSTGLREIISVTDGIATLDASAGTPGSTGGTGNVGGALASISSIANVVTAGNKVWIKGTSAATDTLSANQTFNDGTAALPIEISGYNSTRGDLTGSYASIHGDNGFLTTTNFPVIAGGASYLVSLGSYNLLSAVKFTGSRAGAVLASVSGKGGYRVFRVIAINTNNASSSARAATFSNSATTVTIVDSEFTYSGGVSGAIDLVIINDNLIYGCRMTSDSSTTLSITGAQGTIIENLFYRCTGTAILIAGNNAQIQVISNTFYNCGTGVSSPNAAQTTSFHLSLINNHATGCTTFYNNLYSATSNLPVFAFHNRLRDNTNNYIGMSNTSINDITTDDTDANEYVDVATNNFRLRSGSLGKSAGVIGYADTGAFQRKEPTIPAASDVRDDVTYGESGGDESTGNLVLPAEADVELGVGYGSNGTEFTGTLVGGGEQSHVF